MPNGLVPEAEVHGRDGSGEAVSLHSDGGLRVLPDRRFRAFPSSQFRVMLQEMATRQLQSS